MAGDADPGVGFWAAMILMHNGDKTRPAGIVTLRRILTGEKAGDFYSQAMDELLAAKADPAAMALAVGVIDKLQDRSGNLSYQRRAILKRLLLAGRSEALDYIVRSLADTTPAGTSSGTSGG